jgi:hypothetical protein
MTMHQIIAELNLAVIGASKKMSISQQANVIIQRREELFNEAVEMIDRKPTQSVLSELEEVEEENKACDEELELHFKLWN